MIEASPGNATAAGPIRAAQVYEPADDLWIVTSYFNAAGFKIKKRNYQLFAEKMAASGLRLVTIECAFGDAPFALPDSPDGIRVRTRDVLWQKERLLNLAIARLPAACQKVVWIDFDVLFTNPRWAVTTSRLLEDYPVVHPFERTLWLPSGTAEYRGEGHVWPGFGAVHASNPELVRGDDFFAHGVPGYAWGARRELIQRHGIYDACVVGGGDHVMAHAMCGDWTARCFGWSLGRHSAHHRHFARWAEAFHGSVEGRIGHVKGDILHLWHGELENRNYTHRHKALRKFEFDPETDLRLGPSQCWEWSSDKPELHEWVAGYFAGRREDDPSGKPLP